MLLDVVLAAGGTPAPGDRLFPLTQGRPKALVPLAGQPLAQWVLTALDQAETVRQVVVVGPAAPTALYARKLVGFIPDQGDLLANLHAGAAHLRQLDPTATHALAVSADIPAITGPMVDWFVRACLPLHAEAYAALVPAALMERTFPNARRTYVRFREGAFCGADLAVLSLNLGQAAHPLWPALIAARKSYVQQARLIGLGLAWKILTGQATLAEAEARISTKLGVRGQILVSPYAALGMDVDKPHHHAVLTRHLTAA